MNEGRVVSKLLEMIRRAGAEGEVFLVDSRGVRITIQGEEREDLQFLEELGVSVRVIKTKRMGFSFTSDLSDKGLSIVVREALENSRHGSPDPANGFTAAPVLMPRVVCYDPLQENVSLGQKIELVRAMREFAKNCDPRITAVSETIYRDKISRVSIANTGGVNISFLSSLCVGDIEAIASDGFSTSSASESGFALSVSGLSPRVIGEGASRKALSRLGAKTFRTGKTDLVLDAEVTAGLLKTFAPAFFADNVIKGKSLFQGKLFRKIASSSVTIIDNGLLVAGEMTRPVDGEGVPHQETILVNQGNLTGFLNDFYTAIKTDAKPTGNSQRLSYNEAPAIGPTNLYLAPGQVSKEELLRNVKRGLYIHYVLGLHTIDSISGEFSVGAWGTVIKDGQLTYPVEGVAIAGNMKDLLNSVAEIANDLRFFNSEGGVGGCAVLLKDMSVSGS